MIPRVSVKCAADFVARRAFCRSAANRSNHAAKFRRLDKLAKIRARGFGNAFFHQRAAEIVRAGIEAIERKLKSELHPRHLNIFDRAMQQHARQRMHAQMIVAFRAGASAAVLKKPRLFVNEAERHEFREAAGAFLNRAQQQNVPHPVGGLFDVAVHHRRGRWDAELVRRR